MSTNKFQYWPNTDGNLGNIKVQISTNAEDWPDGDALIGNFVYKEGELVDLVDIKALIVNDTKTTTINYDYVNIELPFAEDAMTINPGPRNKYLFVKFNDKVVEEGDSVIVTLKYKGCKNVNDVKAVDPDYLTNDIVDGVWSEGLGDLEDSSRMFLDCTNLTSFSSDLSSLTNGMGMFAACPNLTSFTSDLPNLTDSIGMFAACINLESFSSNLSNLRNGYSMFENCSRLTSFTSDLPSLTKGNAMFSYCKLDTSSIQKIADTINTYNGIIHIGIGNSEPNEQETTAFNKMVSKGWTVYVNGSSSSNIWNPTSITPENGEEIITPLPYYAKPVPATEETASYVDANGNYYNIVGAQFIYGDDLSTYGMFTCEEDAAANMRLTKIEQKN